MPEDNIPDISLLSTTEVELDVLRQQKELENTTMESILRQQLQDQLHGY